MSLMALGHVLPDGGVAPGDEAAQMGSNALAGMEDLDRGGGEPGVQLLAGQLVGHAVIVAINLDVIVDRRPDRFPLRHHIAYGGQRLKRRAVEFGIERGAGALRCQTM